MGRATTTLRVGLGAGDAPEAGSPADILRGLVLAAGAVTEAEADLLGVVLARLQKIEREAGRDAARAAALRVRAAWLRGDG